MEQDILYDVFMETKEGFTISFYITDNPNENENILDSEDSFDKGDCWSIDANNNELLYSAYVEDFEDDSFVLIPKSSVIKVWKQKK